MVWYMIWYIRYDTIWYIIWYDTIRYDIYDKIWYDICDMIWYMLPYDTIWYGTLRYNTIWYMMIYDMIWYDMIWYVYLLTTIVLTPGGSSSVHNYTQTVHRTTQLTTLVGKLSGIRTRVVRIKLTMN